MKNRLTIIFLLTLIFAAKAGTEMAQTPSSAENKTDAAHTLTEAQKQAIAAIRSATEKKAVLPGLRLVITANRIYENMLADKPDEQLRQRLSKELDETVVGLLHIKGQSFREAVNVLTPEQKQLIKSELKKPGAPGDLMELIVKTFKLPEK